jgi:conjugal transfer ATP-binding protein TraC
MAANTELTAAAKNLAFNIREFTSKGVYGKFFIGPSTFDIRRDPFVVLELENLKPLPDLYRVVTMLVINGVTQDLYLSDRSRQKFVIFEEAWQFLGEAAMIKPVVEEGYRRARKYNGSFMVVVQSIVDLDSFGDVGKVINHNSAYKMFLESGAIEDAQKKGIIDYDTFTLKLLKSCKSNPPKYSEIFFDTPFGCGVARLVVNDYAYFVYTSNATEIAAIEGLVKKDGLTYHEAIMEMVQRRQQHR